MKLPMENRLEAQRLPSESITAWREVLICDKAAANRARLLFSRAGWSLTRRTNRNIAATAYGTGT